MKRRKTTDMNKQILIFIISGLIICTNSFGCTIFTFTVEGKTFFCNNEDCSNPDTEIRFYPSENGKYAWVYFGLSNDWAQGGVNEKGLCWDWVAGIKEDSWKEDKTKETLIGNPSEKMIKECSTVEEAILFYEKYNEVSFSYARTMIADRFGNSAIIGWKDGKIYIERNVFNLQSYGYKGQEVYSYFSNNTGDRDISFLADALNEAHQEGQAPTQYSNIISLSDGKLYLYKNHNFNEYVEIDYIQKLNNGYSRYKIPHLFDENKRFLEVTLKKKGSIHSESSSVWIEHAEYKTDTFSFCFEGNRLSGFIDVPADNKVNSIIILVGEQEKTDYGFRDWYEDELYKNFTDIGVSCVRWDKAGCGKSEGNYNQNQSIHNSAKEVIAAIKEIKRLSLPGSEKIGLWSIGKGGVISPYVIQDFSNIDYWITVNGKNDLNNRDYIFESHLRQLGKSESQAKLLVREYNTGGHIFETGGTFEDYLSSQQNFRKDTDCMDYTGASYDLTEEGYYKEQASYMNNINYKRDSITKSIIVIPDFDNVLNSNHSPVLALFGEKNSQSDWKRTKSLYHNNLGKSDNTRLTIKTFSNGNHNMLNSKTGSYDEQMETYQYCVDYLDTMRNWLIENKFGE